MKNITNKQLNLLAPTSLQTFLEQKKESLNTDKSYKSSWDAPILKLLDYINIHENIYSVSSCSGRISMMTYEENQDESISVQKKYDASFGYVTHDPIDIDKEWDSINELIQNAIKNKETIWFQQEPVIIHIRTISVELAMHFVHLFHTWGYKRSGLSTIKNQKYVIWVASTEEMKTPIVKNGKYLISDEYLKLLIFEANKRLIQTHRKIAIAETGILTYSMNEFSQTLLDFWFGPVKRKQRKETPAPICKIEEFKKILLDRWIILPRESIDRFKEWPKFSVPFDFIVNILADFVIDSLNEKTDRSWILALIIYLDQFAYYNIHLNVNEDNSHEIELKISLDKIRSKLDKILEKIEGYFNSLAFVPIERVFIYSAALNSMEEKLKLFGSNGINHLIDPNGEFFVFSKDRKEIFSLFKKL